MKVLLISTYELGRQPFGLASPATWLRARGHDVTVVDLSRQDLNETAANEARLIAFFVPMHTAARLTLPLIPALRALNPSAVFCVYGLYASLIEESCRKAGVRHFFGGEFEQGLCDLADALARLPAPTAPDAKESGCGARFLKRACDAKESVTGVGGPVVLRADLPRARVGSRALQHNETVSLARQRFLVPDRSGLSALRRYAHVVMPEGSHRVAGYTEASRGCKHRCRHCPIVPVYNGIFRVVEPDVVLADIRHQVVAGAQHITFGDPDFFNGVGHALAIIRELHRKFPEVTYDATIKIEHLRKHEREITTLRETNCLFVTTAVESLDDDVLRKLEKGHTRDDFLRVVNAFRETGLALLPTFVAFTPWTTLDGYCDMLDTLADLDLIENVAPIQLAIRLLISAKSRLLELPEITSMVEPFDEKLLVYPWQHPDARVDLLATQAESIAAEAEKKKWLRDRAFAEIREAAAKVSGAAAKRPPSATQARTAVPAVTPFARTGVPYLNEPWYC